MIELETIYHHAHYPDGGPVRVLRCPGERYRVTDGPGLTARQYATTMIALGVARRVDPVRRDPKPSKSKGPRAECES